MAVSRTRTVDYEWDKLTNKQFCQANSKRQMTVDSCFRCANKMNMSWCQSRTVRWSVMAAEIFAFCRGRTLHGWATVHPVHQTQHKEEELYIPPFWEWPKLWAFQRCCRVHQTLDFLCPKSVCLCEYLWQSCREEFQFSKCALNRVVFEL